MLNSFERGYWLTAEFPEVPAFAIVTVPRFERTALGKRKFVIRQDRDEP